MKFDDFFEEIHGYPPFRWQSRLADQILEAKGQWPDCLELPTSSGKTATIDIAIFVLAKLALKGDQANLFRRIFFVVDRRLIVDEALERAKKIREKLLEPKAGSTLEQVALGLNKLAAKNELEALKPGPKNVNPLEAYAMRGGVFRDLAWTSNPIQPIVVCSTVDQLGSRLLFRGYGSSSTSHSLQAGLVANDALVILDEAHCSNPFLQTLSKVQAYQQNQAGRPFKLVVMSATPPPGANRIFSLEPAVDLADKLLEQRLQAKKMSQLLQTKDVIKELVARAHSLFVTGQKNTVVFVNRVRTARDVARRLKELCKDETDVVLLTGRMREVDRVELLKKLNFLKTAADKSSKKAKLIVATQCLEVGADLDFQALVTECASISALRQRFGRLDRNGEQGLSDAFVVMGDKQLEPKKPDPVYDTALPECWKWLVSHATLGVVDFGVLAMNELLEKNPSDSIDTEQNQAPVLFPAYLDHLVQTDPAPEPKLNVGLFLRGPQSSAAEVRVLIRADLKPNVTAADFRKAIGSLANVLSPCSAETFPIPLSDFKRWLAGEDQFDGSDLEGVGEDEEPIQSKAAGRWAIAWTGRPGHEAEFVQAGSKIEPGQLFMVSAGVEGLHLLGEIPTGETWLLDRGDEVQFRARRKVGLRLFPFVFSGWRQSPSSEGTQDKETALASLEKSFNRLDLDEDTTKTELLAELFRCNELLPTETQILVERLDKKSGPEYKKIRWELLNDNPVFERTLILRLPGFYDPAEPLEIEMESDDERSIGTQQHTLRAHCDGVAHLAQLFAQNLGLPEERAELLKLSGLAHDLGKADPAFQAWLRGGNQALVGPGIELLAKSKASQSKQERTRARKRAEYPAGGRHELVSAQALSQSPALLKRVKNPELLIHLVASHHGHCRPFAPWVSDPRDGQETLPFEVDGTELVGPVKSGMEKLTSGQSERFWTLIREQGWWGLSFLEAILVGADHSRSGWEREDVRQ
jgi:CRISPR-associated endonuclease/helicase Cas3